MFILQVKVTDWDGFGVSNAEIKLCKSLNETFDDVDKIPQNISDSENLKKTLNKCDSAKSNEKGFASFVYSIPNNLEYIYLKVSSIFFTIVFY